MPDVDDGLHEIHRTLAAQGMLQDWRDEWIEVLDWSGVLCMGRLERAASPVSYTPRPLTTKNKGEVLGGVQICNKKKN